MKPHLQAALGFSALMASASKSPSMLAALMAVDSPYSAGYALGMGALVLVLSLAGSRVLGLGLSALAGGQRPSGPAHRVRVC